MNINRGKKDEGEGLTQLTVSKEKRRDSKTF